MRAAARTWQTLLFAGLAMACRGGGDPPVLLPAGDAAVDATPDATPDARPPDRGTRRTYVVSRLQVPTTVNDAAQLALDIDEVPAEGADNELGLLFARLHALVPDLAIAAETDDAVDHGRSIMLVDVYFDRDLIASPHATVWLGPGGDPQPPPCDGPDDHTCRRHLDSHGTFARAGAAGVPIAGAIEARRFRGSDGSFVLPLALPDGTLAELPVEHAQADLVNLADASFLQSRLGGAIRASVVDAQVMPALRGLVSWVYDAECPPPRAPPACGCTAEETGGALRDVVDSDGDCELSVAELDRLLGGMAKPDLDLDGDGLNESYSIAVGVLGVAGAFPEP